MLVDIVSRGGNFLLDIGPTADGRIPVIMQERLLEIGRWLDVNGAAIYGSMPWKHSVQWSKGQVPEEKRGDYNVQYDILKLTVDPDPGQAVKEVFFTRNGTDLFAITPRWPGSKLVLRDVKVKAGATVSLLGQEGNLKWKQDGANLVITVPSVNPDTMQGMYAHVFRISGIRD